jgi:hypothetical protein
LAFHAAWKKATENGFGTLRTLQGTCAASSDIVVPEFGQGRDGQPNGVPRGGMPGTGGMPPGAPAGAGPGVGGMTPPGAGGPPQQAPPGGPGDRDQGVGRRRRRP